MECYGQDNPHQLIRIYAEKTCDSPFVNLLGLNILRLAFSLCVERIKMRVEGKKDFCISVVKRDQGSTDTNQKCM